MREDLNRDEVHVKTCVSACAMATIFILGSACSRDLPTAGDVAATLAGKPGGSTSGDPTVTDTDPPAAPRDTTLDVKVFGSGFDRGSAVAFALDGVTSDKVVTNSTRYVSSSQLQSNVTIAADAVEDLYDVIVTTSRGKKGIGTEIFAVADQYVLTMSQPADRIGDPTWRGLVTDVACNGSGFIVASARSNPTLRAGSIENPGPDLNLRLVNTGATWTRTYDAGRTLGEASPEPNFSPFNGCYGATYADPQTGNLGFSGNLFIWFETHKGKPTVRFTWHFDYFNPPGTNPFENLSLLTGPITVDHMWNGGTDSIRVAGLFDIGHNGDFAQRRRNDQGTIPLDFMLKIEPRF